MDQYTRAWYELQFRVAFLEKRGNEFQDFFSSLMELFHRNGDFIRTRPWGNVGDRKNDGYLRSERTLFQVYAPNEIEATRTIAKIEEDFFGALPYWQEYFDTWVFVHDSRLGLGPDVEAKLLALDLAHFGIRVRSWGFEELRNKLFSLDQTDIASLLGPVPSRYEVLNVRVPEIETILGRVTDQSQFIDAEIRPVPPGKLEANGLSDWVQQLLKIGMQGSERVKQFFEKWHDPTLGDRVAQVFRQEYSRLRSQEFRPDDVFAELQAFLGGQSPAAPQRQAAVLTVLAYLFEACDIFEAPRDEFS